MTRFEEERIEFIKRGIEYNVKELNFTNQDVVMWLDGIMFIESDCSEEYFETLENLKDLYIGRVL